MMHFTKTEVDLYQAAFHTSELLRGSFEGKRIDFKIEGDSGLTVSGDKRNIESVFSNLISNAIKFTPKGGRITVSFVSQDEFFQASVSDNGIGIPVDLQDSIFSPASKSNRPGTEGEASSGLGLLLCNELIRLHGGRIWFESEAGLGTTFYFSLPRQI